MSLRSTASFTFNTGSQKSCITVDVKKQLRLKTIDTEKIIIKTFGSTEEKISFVGVVNLKIKCRNYELVNTEALSVPAVYSRLTEQKPLEITKLMLNLENYILLIFQ